MGRIYGAIFLVFCAAFAVGRCHAGQYSDYATQMEQKYELESGLLKDICYVESHWRPEVHGYHGEVGICQIKPNTVKMFCPSCVFKTESIYQGMRGDKVKKVQTAVGVKADGVFGLKTHTAISSFQSKHRLLADGIVGPRTWKALFGSPMDGQAVSQQLLDPKQNIEYAARYLVWLRDYLDTNDRDILAAAYNGGPANATVVYMLKVRNAQVNNVN